MGKKIVAIFLSLILLTSAGLYRLSVLNQKPSDPAEFTLVNKIEIYLLGLVMSGVAYPLYPEVSREHLALYWPSAKIEQINDDFFMRSVVVQDAIIKAISTGKEYRLQWPITSYTRAFDSDSYWESRVALAFNGGWLRVEGDEVIARIPIAYPKRALAPLIEVPVLGTLAVQEGLFWVLQQEGWYHTKEVEWLAPLNSAK